MRGLSRGTPTLALKFRCVRIISPLQRLRAQVALQTFWGSTDVLAAALAEGLGNIWNNAALIAYIQKHY